MTEFPLNSANFYSVTTRYAIPGAWSIEQASCS